MNGSQTLGYLSCAECRDLVWAESGRLDRRECIDLLSFERRNLARCQAIDLRRANHRQVCCFKCSHLGVAQARRNLQVCQGTGLGRRKSYNLRSGQGRYLGDCQRSHVCRGKCGKLRCGKALELRHKQRLRLRGI